MRAIDQFPCRWVDVIERAAVVPEDLGYCVFAHLINPRARVKLAGTYTRYLCINPDCFRSSFRSILRVLRVLRVLNNSMGIRYMLA
jgi:FPC/CPF motif-containing protein YcgG